MVQVAVKSQVEPRKATVASRAVTRSVAFDYLRSFVVVLVVWHHAILAYAMSAMINPVNPVATFTPVADQVRWLGFDLLAGFNDTFFMALMFFISGLFVWPSLARKGTAAFLRERLVRLGIPFVVGLFVLVPLAYYPAQLTAELVNGGDTSFVEFWTGLVRSGFGTAGPLWFVWMLLVFDGVAAVIYLVLKPRDNAVDQRTRPLFEKPMLFFGALLLASMAAYVPMTRVFEPIEWLGVGPFVAQAVRMVFYLVYFLGGVALGAYGLERSLLRQGGPLATRWWLWLPAGVLAFLPLLALVVGSPSRPLASALVFTVTCGLLVFGFTALFLRFATRRSGVMDSLTANAYGIYIVHYAFVTWLQFGFLGIDLPAVAKGTLVFVAALALSWSTVALLRRVPSVARVI
jgi:hypothetical protein